MFSVSHQFVNVIELSIAVISHQYCSVDFSVLVLIVFLPLSPVLFNSGPK